MLGITLVQKDAQSVVEHYEKAYFNRYGVKPILASNGSDFTIVQDLVRTHGKDLVIKYINAYLKMNEDWYIRNAHSLHVLKTNINQINIIQAKSEKQHTFLKKEHLLEVACDSCWRTFLHVDSPPNYDLVWLKCQSCIDSNAPWKYPTKKEFYRNWGAMKGFTAGGLDPSAPGAYEKIFKKKDPYPDRLVLNIGSQLRVIGNSNDDEERLSIQLE